MSTTLGALKDKYDVLTDSQKEQYSILEKLANISIEDIDKKTGDFDISDIVNKNRDALKNILSVQNSAKKSTIDYKEEAKKLGITVTELEMALKELKKEELKQQQVELWRRTLQICTRLFHTSTSYKKLHAIETAKFKKEREEKQKEINSIQKEINEVFIEAIQELREQYPKLTQEDLFYCILQYLRLSTSTIKFCMRVESNQALTQRKYRIKKQISPQTFSIIFNENSPSEGVL